jgi:hypothetical protein
MANHGTFFDSGPTSWLTGLVAVVVVGAAVVVVVLGGRVVEVVDGGAVVVDVDDDVLVDVVVGAAVVVGPPVVVVDPPVVVVTWPAVVVGAALVDVVDGLALVVDGAPVVEGVEMVGLVTVGMDEPPVPLEQAATASDRPAARARPTAARARRERPATGVGDVGCGRRSPGDTRFLQV